MRRVVNTPVPTSETPEAMGQLYLAYMNAGDRRMEPLLMIPCVILDFLCIHPFPDGNGRTSRLLTTALLCNSNFYVCRFVLLDGHISLTKGASYRPLRNPLPAGARTIGPISRSCATSSRAFWSATRTKTPTSPSPTTGTQSDRYIPLRPLCTCQSRIKKRSFRIAWYQQSPWFQHRLSHRSDVRFDVHA